MKDQEKVSLVRLPSKDGTDPEKLQLFIDIDVKKPMFSMEAGSSPEKLVPERINVSSGLFHVKPEK
jgi:hypothetical protein